MYVCMYVCIPIVTSVSRTFSVLSTNPLLRYLARSHFSPVFRCYISISRILILLFYSIVTYLAHTTTIINTIKITLYLDT